MLSLNQAHVHTMTKKIEFGAKNLKLNFVMTNFLSLQPSLHLRH